MPKRDLISEIKEIQKRTPDSAIGVFAHQDAIKALINLMTDKDEAQYSPDIESALFNYATIRLVAVIQSCLKNVIRDVVDDLDDKGLPLPEIQKDTTITLDMVREMKNRNFTIGEFMAHLVSAHSWEQVCGTFKSIAGADLMAMVKEMIEAEQMRSIGVNEIYPALEALFKARNILCHELALEKPITRDTLAVWLLATLKVTTVMGVYVAEAIGRRLTKLSAKVRDLNIRKALNEIK